MTSFITHTVNTSRIMALLIASLLSLHCSDQIMYYEPEYYALLESSGEESSSIEESSAEYSNSSEDEESRPKRIARNSSSEYEESSANERESSSSESSSSRKKSERSSSSEDEKKRSSSSKESSSRYSCEPERSSVTQKSSSHSSDMAMHKTVIAYAGYSSENVISESDSLYDADGKLIQWAHREPMEEYVEGALNEHLDTTRYTYNSQNLLVEQKTYRSGEVAYRTTYTYNGYKRLVFKVNYLQTSQWASSEANTYDAKGRLKEQKTTFKESETETHEYRYYSDHIEQDYFRGETLNQCYTDSIDSLERVVEHYMGCEESKQELIKAYTYDENGEVSILEEYSDRNGDGEWSLYARKEYTYDQGRIGFINTIIDEEPSAEYTETFTYDDDGRIIQYDHELATGWISGYQWSYHDSE